MEIVGRNHFLKLTICYDDGFGVNLAAVPEWFAAGAFGLVTLFTLLLRNVPELQSNLLYAIFFCLVSSLC